MTEDDHFFSTLSGFLAECDVPATFESTSSPTSGLLLSSTDFLVETETFLSSLPSDQETSEDGQNVQEDVNSLAAKKREIRNVQAAKRRLRYRQKLKGEKEKLLQQEVDLSRELNKLQRVQAEDQSNGVDRMALGVWRAIATRQKDRRTEAEQTQRQLRAAVIGRARMIHQLNALLQRPRVEEENRKLCGGATSSGGGDGAVLFKTFLGELDVVYAQTDQVMQEAEFHESEFRGSSRMEYKPKRTWKQGVELFDSADRTVLPFGYEETCRAMSLVMMTDPELLRYNEKPQVPEDTITVKYDTKCSLEPGDTSKLVVHVAVRRYKEPGRLVFVWRALNECEGNLSGYHTDETGWLVLRPHNDSTSSTVLDSYVRFVPMSVGASSGNKADIDMDRFTKLVAKTGEDDVNEMMQMLEKMLVGDDRSKIDSRFTGS